MTLLARMRDLNAELLKQLALGRRSRPPSERMCRLQMELPLWAEKDAANDGEQPAANDGETPARKKPKKRGPKTKHRHGRAKLPEHLERKIEQHLVDGA